MTKPIAERVDSLSSNVERVIPKKEPQLPNFAESLSENGLPLTVVIDLDGRENPELGLIELVSEQIISGYAILRKSDDSGDYAHILVERKNLKALGDAYDVSVGTFFGKDYPMWAKRNGQSVHRFLGVPIVEDGSD